MRKAQKSGQHTLFAGRYTGDVISKKLPDHSYAVPSSLYAVRSSWYAVRVSRTMEPKWAVAEGVRTACPYAVPPSSYAVRDIWYAVPSGRTEPQFSAESKGAGMASFVRRSTHHVRRTCIMERHSMMPYKGSISSRMPPSEALRTGSLVRRSRRPVRRSNLVERRSTSFLKVEGLNWH